MTNGHDRLHIGPTGLRSWHQWSSGRTSVIAATMTIPRGSVCAALWEALPLVLAQGAPPRVRGTFDEVNGSALAIKARNGTSTTAQVEIARMLREVENSRYPLPDRTARRMPCRNELRHFAHPGEQQVATANLGDRA
jgi:hypothetical protein